MNKEMFSRILSNIIQQPVWTTGDNGLVHWSIITALKHGIVPFIHVLLLIYFPLTIAHNFIYTVLEDKNYIPWEPNIFRGFITIIK